MGILYSNTRAISFESSFIFIHFLLAQFARRLFVAGALLARHQRRREVAAVVQKTDLSATAGLLLLLLLRNLWGLVTYLTCTCKGTVDFAHFLLFGKRC